MEDNPIDQALDAFAQLIAEESQNSLETVDPYDLYQHRIKAKVFSNQNHFRERFVRGYHAIKDELEKNK